MIPAPFEYARARSLADALKAAGAKGTKVICGGQSLIPLLRFRLAQPKRLVDIAHLAALRGITRAKSVIRIGAATTYRELLASPLLSRDVPLIADVTVHIGDLQVRNLGTIGGGLAHADPASDMPAAMLALDANFVLRSTRAKRVVAARDFFRGPFETVMKANELLVEIRVPIAPKGTGSAYASFEQAASGYPLAGAAAVVTRARRTIAAARLAFTGLADTPFLSAAAAELVGTNGSADVVARVAKAATAGVRPNADIHASGEYRLHLAAVAARRALLGAIERSA
jgi:aerobic carbon-monoxide dehydrogenase medium subunit